MDIIDNEEDTTIFNDLDSFIVYFDPDSEPLECVARLYVATRLDKIRTNKNEKELNQIGKHFILEYINNNISLDLMLNALYNYINFNNKLPSIKTVKDIVAFLDDYAEE